MLPNVRTLFPLAALALAAPFAAAPAMAQQAAAVCAYPMGHHGAMPRLTVTGEGETRVAPDMAVVMLGVTTQAASAAEAMTQNSTQQQTVIDALKEQGIAAEDIQTSGLNLSPMMNYEDGKPPAVTGYQAQNVVTVRIKDLPRLGEVLDGIVQVGANEIQGISFTREDDQAATDEARAAAVAEAQRRGVVLAQAAGLSLGPILAIRDTISSGGPQPMGMGMRAMDAKASSVPVEMGQLSLTANVTMDFALVGEGAMNCAPEGHGADHAMPDDSAADPDASPVAPSN